MTIRSDLHYTSNLALTRANDAAHEEMMQWYCTKLDVERSLVAVEIASLSDVKRAELQKAYKGRNEQH